MRPQVTGGPPPVGLLEAFSAYEEALGSDDLEALDRLFAPGVTTLRADADGLLVGHGRIRDFRAGRGGAPARRLVEVHVRVLDPDHATIVAATRLQRGGRGVQTQTWERQEVGWVVTAAHVQVPAPAVDTRVWRVVGTPLVTGTTGGPLSGETVAVKDLYAVAGHRVGAGNPTWLAGAPVEEEHAWAVEQLLDAGADVTGLARTDELAYSLAGTNAHTGTPANPAAPGRIPGGSSSGSATAVSLGQVSVGLGTDTGGSVRVPAAYQGLWGLRTTHDLVPRTGLLPLAPAFDTVGWLARDPDTLARVGDVLLPDSPEQADDVLTEGDLVVAPALLDLAEADVRAAAAAFAHDVVRTDWPSGLLDGWLSAFVTWQAHQAWQVHGAWLEHRLEALGDDVRPRFERGRSVTSAQASVAGSVVAQARTRVRELVGDRVLVLPAASSVAPGIGPGLPQRLQQVRDDTLRLTCVAGLGGLPALAVPLRTAEGLPTAACLVAGPGRDRALLALGTRLADAWADRFPEET